MSLHIEISQGLRVDDLQTLQDKVRFSGGRLIAYAEVVSALMLSARSFKVRWVATQGERRISGITPSIVTAILGWWAIAGPYWTITALVWNGRGGFDVTEALLRAHEGNSSLLGYAESSAMGAFHQSASRMALRILGVLAVLILTGIGFLIWSMSSI